MGRAIEGTHSDNGSARANGGSDSQWIYGHYIRVRAAPGNRINKWVGCARAASAKNWPHNRERLRGILQQHARGARLDTQGRQHGGLCEGERSTEQKNNKVGPQRQQYCGTPREHGVRNHPLLVRGCQISPGGPWSGGNRAWPNPPQGVTFRNSRKSHKQAKVLWPDFKLIIKKR